MKLGEGAKSGVSMRSLVEGDLGAPTAETCSGRLQGSPKIRQGRDDSAEGRLFHPYKPLHRAPKCPWPSLQALLGGHKDPVPLRCPPGQVPDITGPQGSLCERDLTKPMAVTGSVTSHELSLGPILAALSWVAV